MLIKKKERNRLKITFKESCKVTKVFIENCDF